MAISRNNSSLQAQQSNPRNHNPSHREGDKADCGDLIKPPSHCEEQRDVAISRNNSSLQAQRSNPRNHNPSHREGGKADCDDLINIP